jgi:hypothetical protein
MACLIIASNLDISPLSDSVILSESCAEELHGRIVAGLIRQTTALSPGKSWVMALLMVHLLQSDVLGSVKLLCFNEAAWG